jgi:hypothetical protein
MTTGVYNISYVLTSELLDKQRAYHKIARKKYGSILLRTFDYLYLLFWIALSVAFFWGAFEIPFEIVIELGLGSTLWLFIRLPAIRSLIWSMRYLQFPRENEVVEVEVKNVEEQPQLFFWGKNLPWERLYMVLEIVDGFLIYTSEIHYIWLPIFSLENGGCVQWAKEAFKSHKVFHTDLNV